MSEQDALDKIRELLLAQQQVQLETLKKTSEQNVEGISSVEQSLSARIAQLENEFPDVYHSVVQQIFDHKLQNSRAEIIDMIAPHLGSLINKYISYQIAALRESIQASLDRQLGFLKIFRRKRSQKDAVDSLMILQSKAGQKILQVIVIEKDTGLVIAHTENEQIPVDPDIAAGMLTAIRQYAEDAFQKNENISQIAYHSFTILIQPKGWYYISVIISDILTPQEYLDWTEIVNFFVDSIDELKTGKQRLLMDEHILNQRLSSLFFQRELPKA